MAFEFKLLVFSIIVSLMITPIINILPADETEDEDNNWQCPWCGTWNENEYNFCPDCGEPKLGLLLDSEDSFSIPDEWKCPTCGENNALEYEFCKYCREKRPSNITDEMVEKKTMVESVRWICPECGEENQIAWDTCFYCGAVKPDEGITDFVIKYEEKTPTLRRLGKGFMIAGVVTLGASGVMFLIGSTTPEGLGFYIGIIGGIIGVIGGGSLLGLGLLFYVLGKPKVNKTLYEGLNFNENNTRTYGENLKSFDRNINILSFGVRF